MSHRFTTRRSVATAAQLDAGLAVRTAPSAQRTIFTGADDLSLQALSSELSEMLGSLRVRSFRLRAELEEITIALQHNVECGFWLWSRRAARDLAGLLGHLANTRQSDVELCIRGLNAAVRISDLCLQEASRGIEEDTEDAARCFDEARSKAVRA
jgi:hypothetical protein